MRGLVMVFVPMIVPVIVPMIVPVIVGVLRCRGAALAVHPARVAADVVLFFQMGTRCLTSSMM